MSTRTESFIRTWAPLVMAAIGAAMAYGALDARASSVKEQVMHQQSRLEEMEVRIRAQSEALARIDANVRFLVELLPHRNPSNP